MGLLDTYKAIKQDDEEEKKKAAAAATAAAAPAPAAAKTSGLAAAYNALKDEEKKQTPEPASASAYESLLLPTPQQWVERIGDGIRKAGDWLKSYTAEPEKEEKTLAGGKPVIQPVAETTLTGSHKSGKLDDESGSQEYYDTFRTRQNALERYAAAMQPTSDMYLSKATAELADYQQKEADKAKEAAETYGRRAEENKPEIVKQREKTEQARRELIALAYSNNTPEGLKKYEEKLEEFNEANEKLHEMGGRYGLKEDLQTIGENLGAGVLGSIKGIINAAGYAGQEMTRGQLMEQQSVMSGLPGQQEIADSSAKTLQEVKDHGLQSWADPTLNGIGKVGKFLVERPAQAEAEQTAEMWRRAGREDRAKEMDETAKALKSADGKPLADTVNQFMQTAAQHAQASGKVAQALAQTANGVGGMVPSIISNLAIPGSSLWVMGAQAAGNATEEALAAGAQDEKAVLYGGAVAAVEVLTEKLFGGIPGLNVGSLDDAVEKLIKKNIGNEAAQRAILFLVDALGEGAEEFISEFADWGLNKWLVGDDKRSFDEVRKDAWYSAFIGALTSVAMSGPVEIFKSWSPRQIAQKVAREMDARLETERKAEALKLPEVQQETENAAQGRTAEELALPVPAKVAGNETAAQNGAAGAVKAGIVTTIDKPYNGPVPVQTAVRAENVVVPGVSLEQARSFINQALFSAARGESGFKAALKKRYRSVFQRSSAVPVSGLTFDGGDYLVEIGNKVPGKVINDPNLSAEKLALLDVLPDVVKTASYVGSGEYSSTGKRAKPVTRYDYFETPVTVGGKPYIARFDVEVLPDVNNYRTHQIENVDLSTPEGSLVGPEPTAASGGASPQRRGADAAAATSSNQTIAQPAQEVKNDLALPDVPAQAQTQQTEVKPLPTPEEYAKQNEAPDDSWRREESAAEEAARRAAEEEEYRRAQAEDEAEREAARLEREGKQLERNKPAPAPKSRAALKSKVQEIYSIQEGSKGRVNEILDVVADKIQNGQDIPEEMLERLHDALNDKGSYWQAPDDYFRNFRETVKGSRIYVSPELRAEFGDDWKAIASRARKAGITLTSDINDGGVDVHAGELSEIYRGIDPEETDLAKTLETIIDTAERGRGQTITSAEMEDILRGEYGDEAVQQRAEEMERKFRQTLELFRQSAETETAVRAQADAKIRKAQQQAADLAKRQMEKKALRELQNKTLKQLQWLSKNRNKTDAQMRARFDDVLRDIDTIAINTANALHVDKASGMTWKDLADIYKKAKESDPNFLPSKQLDDIVMRLDGDKIGDMDINALQDLYKAAVGLRTEYYNRNNVINDELGRTFADAYHASVDEFKSVKGETKGETKASKWFNREQLTPANYLRRLVGWKKGSTFASFGKQLENGERAYKKYITDASKSLEGFMKENADWVRKADGQGKDAIWYEYEVPKEFTRNGIGEAPTYSKEMVKVWMTPAQKVHLALEVENYDNLRHMEGGRTFADKELYSKGKRAEAFRAGTTVKMTPEWAKRISSDLTPQEKALKNALSKYYNEYSKSEINRVSNVLYGYDRAMSGKYAPIFTNDNYVGHQAGISDTTAEGVGHIKARQVSSNPSYNIGAFDAFERHADQTARFVGYSIPIRNMETLMNWRGTDTSLRDEISHKWGKDAGTAYIDDLMTDLQTTRYNETGAVEGLTNDLLSNYIGSVFGANPGIVLKQAASLPQAGAILGFDTLPSPKQLAKVDRELIGKYTPELDYRQLGYATPETAQLKNNPGLLQRNKALNFLFGGGAITWMDGKTVQSIWPWAENYVSKHFPKLEKGTQEQIDAGESPYYKKVAEVFNEAVSTTQPMYDTMHRAKIMQDGNAVTRAFTMFKTVPLQQYNTLRQAFGELEAAKQSGDAAERKAASRKTANAVTATLGSVAALEGVELLNQLWKNGAKGYRDDDDELTAESIVKTVAERSVKDLAGMVIGGSELSDLIFNKINGKKWYGIEIPGGEQLNDIIDSFSSAAETATKFVTDGADILRNGGDLGEYYRTHGAEYAKALKDAAEKLAMYVKGLPVQNVEKYLGGALKRVAPELYAQIGDLFDTPDRAAMKKTDEKMLPARMRDMLEQRIGGAVEGSAEELARLYGLYGGSVALPDTPGSITIRKDDDTTESRKLSAYDQQVYDRAFKSAVRIPLSGLAADKEFMALDDDAKEAYLKRLYSAAADWAKHSVDENAGGSYSEKIMALRRAGANMTVIMQALAMKSALSPAEFAAWVEDDRFLAGTLDTAKDILEVRSEYDNLKATGLEDQEIFTVADALDGIEGEKTKWKKLGTIAGLDLPQESIDKAASVYLSEAQMEKYQESGMELGEFADLMSRGARINSNAEGMKDDSGDTIDGTKKIEVIRGVDSLHIGEQAKLTLLKAMDYEPKGYDQVKNWMTLTDYADALEVKALASGKKTPGGDTVSGSKELAVMEGINGLKFTPKQKTQIMEALGYEQKDGDAPPIWDTKYHGKDYEAYYYMSDSQRRGYEEHCSWMGPASFADCIKIADKAEGKKDAEGETISGSRRLEVMQGINMKRLSPEQKTQVMEGLGFKMDGDNQAPPIWDTPYKGKDYEAYYYMADGQREKYGKYCDWMPVADYAKYAESIGDFHDIKNDKGKTTVSRKSQVIAYIDALDLTPDQKTALYVASGYNANLKDSGFTDCPWWNRLALRSEYYPTK